MIVKKFEKYDSGEYDYEYGSSCFVLARYKDGWNKLSKYSFGNNEYVPCMISGHGNSQSIWLIGETHGYDINDFEILKGSDKILKDVMNNIDYYSDLNKYNL